MATFAHLYNTLTSFSCSVSVGADPVGWLKAIRMHTLAILGEDKPRFTRMLVHLHLIVYTYIHVKSCSIDGRSLASLQAQIIEWSKLDDLTQLICYRSIYRKLLDSLRTCVSDLHQCASSGYTRKLLDQDLIGAAALLVVILRSGDRRKSLYTLDESKARELLNLMHKISNLTDLDSKIRPIITEAMFTISRKHKCYPECLVLHGVAYSGQAVAGGAFGDIWKGQVRGQAIAIKVMRIFGEDDIEKFLKIFAPQAVLWQRLRHPNVLPFYGVHRWEADPSRICLISPWVENGNIVQYLDKFPDTPRVPLLRDIAFGLKYLHSQEPRIIHSDLKGSNVLITSSLRACIADFDFSMLSEDSRLPLRMTQSGRSGGTLRFMAPELLNCDPDDPSSCRRTLACDIYAYACVCYQVFAGKSPFSNYRNDGGIVLAITSGKRPLRPSSSLRSACELDDEIWNLITWGWREDAEERPSVDDVVATLSRKKMVAFRPASGWDNSRITCSCAAYPGDGDVYEGAPLAEQMSRLRVQP